MTRAASVAPILVMGWGNVSRGDDAIGPLLVEALRQYAASQWPGADTIECLDEFQLQIEHAYDLQDRQQVLFIDASTEATTPFETHAVTAPYADNADSVTPVGASSLSHALSPHALVSIAQNVLRLPLPACTLLAVRAHAFGLGEPLSAEAQGNLAQAEQWAQRWLHNALSTLNP